MNKAKILGALKFFFTSGLWLILVLFVADIVSKAVVLNVLKTEGAAITVIPNFFRIALVFNQGAVAGILRGTGILLPLVSLIGGGLMIFALVRYWKKMSKLSRYAFFLMIPGCFGNLVDRALYNNRGVVDFLEFKFGDFYWPTFNLADSCLVIGVLMILLALFLEERKNSASKNPKEEEEND